MNRNLLKQIWNERRSNAFLWMELFVVFVILWYIVDNVAKNGSGSVSFKFVFLRVCNV